MINNGVSFYLNGEVTKAIFQYLGKYTTHFDLLQGRAISEYTLYIQGGRKTRQGTSIGINNLVKGNLFAHTFATIHFKLDEDGSLLNWVINP